jgi:hypothetical protein
LGALATPIEGLNIPFFFGSFHEIEVEVPLSIVSSIFHDVICIFHKPSSLSIFLCKKLKKELL